MPTYQCPRCKETFTVPDSGTADCPTCRQAAEEGFYCRVDKEIVGPVPREAIQKLVHDGIQVRRTGEEWATATSLPEFSPEESSQPNTPDSENPHNTENGTDETTSSTLRPVLGVLALALLLMVAASGWVFHFASERQNEASTQVADHPSIKTKKASPKVQKELKTVPSTDNPIAKKTIAGEVAKAKAVPAPEKDKQHPQAVPTIQFTIKPVNNDFNRVIVSVTSSDKSTWERLKLTQKNQQFAAAVSLQMISTHEATQFGNGDKKRFRRPPRPKKLIYGKFKIEAGTLLFEPTEALQKGKHYIAIFNPTHFGEKSGLPTDVIQRVYQAGASTPQIVAIHPQSPRLPANLSKFHLSFSEPMQQNDAARFIHLRDISANLPGEKPSSLKLAWSNNGRQCTVSVRAENAKRDAFLKVGNRYRLDVSGEWTSAKGVPLGKDFMKSFRADAADNRKPLPSRWSVRFPRRDRAIRPIMCRMPELTFPRL
jgi:hypothetical protein